MIASLNLLSVALYTASPGVGGLKIWGSTLKTETCAISASLEGYLLG